MTDPVARLSSAIAAARGEVAVLSGAGISVSSDIPAFRGSDGLWARYDPMEYAHVSAFLEDPAKVWRMLRELDAVLEAARPNAAHHALAALERDGWIRAVITQNVDGLHQEAGSEEVVELHGSRGTLTCVECESTVSREEVRDDVEHGRVPTCERCDGLLKPDVVFFGEELPAGAMRRAERLATECELFLVIGTSAEVYPAAALPDLARSSGADVWEINPDPSLRGPNTIPRPAEDALPELADRLNPVSD